MLERVEREQLSEVAFPSKATGENVDRGALSLMFLQGRRRGSRALGVLARVTKGCWFRLELQTRVRCGWSRV